MPIPAHERVLRRSVAAGDCLVWTGTVGHAGYGQVRRHGKMERTHRVIWEFHHGPIPPGLVVCHTCDNPPCVNIDHLWLGTMADNVADREMKGRGVRIVRDVCKWGHPYTEENTYWWRGSRYCAACRDRRNKARARSVMAVT